MEVYKRQISIGDQKNQIHKVYIKIEDDVKGGKSLEEYPQSKLCITSTRLMKSTKKAINAKSKM